MQEGSNQESSSEDPRSRRTQKDKDRPRINMLRVTPSKEVILTPAPEWNEAEGRPAIRRGEDEEDDIAEVEVRFVRRSNEDPREIEGITDEIVIKDEADEKTQERYA